MTDLGNFDPAEAIQRRRQQQAAEEAKKEAERQRVKAQEEQSRANKLKLLRYADQQLEGIDNPVVSEFIVTERWLTLEPEWISSREKRADQVVVASSVVGIFNRTEYKVATRHERQTRYYGSWLSLRSTCGAINARNGLVKLRQPRTGYAFMRIDGWDPRDVGDMTINFNFLFGPDTSGTREIRETETPAGGKPFQIHESLEAAESEYRNISVEVLTESVTQALNFVETGELPEPEIIPYPDH